MTLLYQNPRFAEHQTGPRHPERPERVQLVARHLEREGLDARCQCPEWLPATAEDLALVHSAGYIESVERYALAGGGRIEADTVVSPVSYDVACLAAGAALDAVARVVAGPQRQALCLVRPPGHHALAQNAMGFCLFNNVAIAAQAAVARHGLSRVLIVDWDVHHGNGTQAMFWEDPRVAFFSVHRWPFYPGTGSREETGGGRGLGTTRNLPLEYGTLPSEYHKAVADHLDDFARRTAPELVLISAGFDAHRDDPVGSLGLETEDFGRLSEFVLDLAGTYCQGRVVSVLEGGYNTSALAGSVEAHLANFLSRDARADSARRA